MGISCDCSNSNLFNNELEVDKEKKVNKDFFIDYTSDSIENNENNKINYEFVFKNKSRNSLDNLCFLSSQNFSNNNKNLSIFNLNKFLDKSKERNYIEENEHPENNDNQQNINLKESNKKFNDDFIKIPEINYDSNKLNISRKELIYSNIIEFSPTKKKLKGNEIINDKILEDKPEDEYNKIIFNYINKLRKEPKNVSKDIENIKKYIYIEENNEVIFKKNKIKVNLNKGIQIFDEAINSLKDLQPMEQLIYNKNISIEIPEKEEIINNEDYLNDKVNELNKNGNYIISFWKEIIKDPEVAFLMMVVDDNYIKSGQKRNDLINPEIKYIGINSGEVNNNFVCYITLSYNI